MEQVSFIGYVGNILVSARISMIWGVCAAILSTSIGYGMVKVSRHSPKFEKFVNIISLVCCVIPCGIIWNVIRSVIWHPILAGAPTIIWYVMCTVSLAILGWRLPYRLMKKGAGNVLGVVCLSMARIIAVYAGVSFIWWILNVYFIILNVSILVVEASGVFVKLIIGVCLLNLGEFFLYPISTKEVLIDML